MTYPQQENAVISQLRQAARSFLHDVVLPIRQGRKPGFWYRSTPSVRDTDTWAKVCSLYQALIQCLIIPSQASLTRIHKMSQFGQVQKEDSATIQNNIHAMSAPVKTARSAPQEGFSQLLVGTTKNRYHSSCMFAGISMKIWQPWSTKFKLQLCSSTWHIIWPNTQPPEVCSSTHWLWHKFSEMTKRTFSCAAPTVWKRLLEFNSAPICWFSTRNSTPLS